MRIFEYFLDNVISPNRGCQSFLLAFSLLAATQFSVASEQTRELSITIDDAPSLNSGFQTTNERYRRLLTELSHAEVDEVVFFVRTDQLDGRQSEIEMLTSAGHLVANHSHSHQSLHSVGASEFIDDVMLADQILRQQRNFRPFFRYPYLHSGRDPEEYEFVRRELIGRGYEIGYVTIDTYDFAIQNEFSENWRQYDSKELLQFGERYVSAIMQWVEFYDQLAKLAFNTSISHTLLLHDNDVTSLYIGRLVERLREEGWSIVPPADVYDGDQFGDSPPVHFPADQSVTAMQARIRGELQTKHRLEDLETIREFFSVNPDRREVVLP